MQTPELEVIECYDLPDNPVDTRVYRLLPKSFDKILYRDRVDRAIGWITPEEQDMLWHSKVGVSSSGGMGGWASEILLRAGVGEIRMGDREPFERSNLNRQAGAAENTLGVSKAFATARRMRGVISDTTVQVFPQGIDSQTADAFVAGCDLVFDLIEFFAVGARIQLHQAARRHNVMVLNFDAIGHRSYGFKYTPTSMTVEEALGLTLAEALELERMVKGDVEHEVLSARQRIVEAVMRAFCPELPEYGAGTYSTREAVLKRLAGGQASILPPNPVMAAGFAVNRAIAELVYERSPVPRDFVHMPPMPGYMVIDAMHAPVHTGAWW